jgi:hypothetical protein
MQTSHTSSKSGSKPAASKRWIALCIGTGLLHLMTLNWAGGYIYVADATPQPTQPIKIALHSAPPPTSAPVPAPAQTPLKPPAPASAERKPHARKRLVLQALALPPALAVADLSPAIVAIPPVSVDAMPATNALPPPIEPLVIPQSDLPVIIGKETPVPFKVSLPPPAELKYQVLALRDGQNVYGKGTMRWQYQDGSYSIKGETSILFLTLLSFTSEGKTDINGIAPVIYSEKRFRRSETNTHFNRERHTISFSASINTYPRQGGEQDRASILWQLAGIGRGDGERFSEGFGIDVFVAGVRDGEIWHFDVLGMEQINLDGAETMTWHLRRAPRAGSYDKKLDVWLAPRNQWYPVRLRETENNGNYLDMSVTSVTPLQTNNNTDTPN